jgi:hypothetical protein
MTRRSIIAVVILGALAWWLWPKKAAREDVPVTEQPIAQGSRPVPETGQTRELQRPDTGPGGILYQAPWGSGESAIGRSVAHEGNPEGPMSFAFGDDGTLWILDQANGRLLRLPRGASKPIPVRLPLVAPQDVKVAKNGSVVVLDRLGDRSLYVADKLGAPLGTIPLKGREPGGITGVFTDQGEIYIERAHGMLAHVGSLGGAAADDGVELIGRPTPDGSALVNAGKQGKDAVWLTVLDRAAGAQRFTKLFTFGEPVQAITELDADTAHTVYLGVIIGAPGHAHLVVQCVNAQSGDPLGRVDLPTSPLADETFRDLAVLPDGGFAYAERDANGVKYALYYCAP